MHVHTSEISGCASVSTERTIDLYAEKGYDGLVISNHLNEWTMRNLGEVSWDSFIDSFALPVISGKEYAARYGMKIFFGCELRFSGDENDYLIYGITADFLKENPDILTIGIKRLKRLADESSFLIYQAHPFRNGMKITKPEYLHGIEVWNGHPGHNSRNDIARLWADMHKLYMISGSDFHDEDGKATGGMLFFDEVNNEHDLCRALRGNNYRLICGATSGLSDR